MIQKPSLDHQDAGLILERCLDAAAAQGAAVSIAIVDDAGQLLRFARMDGARGYTVDLATRKARVAASVGIATRIITEMSRANPGPASDAAVGAGGLPVLDQRLCAGGIGISGTQPDIDDAIAAAGVAALAR